MTESTLKLKIQLVDPPVGYAFCLQRGKGVKSERLDHLEVDEDGKSSVEFAFDVTVRAARSRPEPDFFGPFTQGTPGRRFFYVCIGRVQPDSVPRWEGRVKVPLSGIDWPMINAANKTSCFLLARYRASRSDGQPVYASVSLEDEGWSVQKES